MGLEQELERIRESIDRTLSPREQREKNLQTKRELDKTEKLRKAIEYRREEHRQTQAYNDAVSQIYQVRDKLREVPDWYFVKKISLFVDLKKLERKARTEYPFGYKQKILEEKANKNRLEREAREEAEERSLVQFRLDLEAEQERKEREQYEMEVRNGWDNRGT